MASSIGSPLNPNKLANTFKSLKNTKDLTNKTIATTNLLNLAGDSKYDL